MDERMGLYHRIAGKASNRYILGSILTVLILAMLWLKDSGQNGVIARVDTPSEGSRSSGLAVHFLDPDTRQSDWRISRLLALYVEVGKPVTPFLEPGPFQASWQGWIDITEEDEYTFRNEGNGLLEMTLGNSIVLQPGEARSQPVSLTEGTYPLKVNFTGPDNGPARMRLLWSGTLFGPEPIPPTLLSHDGSNKELQQAALLREGRMLMAEHLCVNCHQPEDPSFIDESRSMPELAIDAPDLSSAGSSLREGWMRKWVKDPRAVRHSAKMPRMNFNDQQVADIAAWLATLGKAPPPPERPATASGINEGGQLYASLGCVGCHTLGNNDSDDDRLSLAGVAGKWYPSALEDYLREPSKNHQWTGMPDFRLDEQQTGAIAAFLLDQSEPQLEEEPPLNGDAMAGKVLVREHGCVSCHVAPVENQLTSPSLEDLMRADTVQDFPASTRDSREINYHPELSDRERLALRTFIQEGFESLNRRSPIEFASRQIRTLNCRACHQIDGQSDKWSDYKHEVAHLIEDDEDDMFDRRPELTWVGEQLQPEWLEKTLAGTLEHEARPWLQSRMPVFGANPSLIAEGMMAAHGYDDNFQHISPDPELVAHGDRLTGFLAGFNCESCHTTEGGALPAANLELLGERLRPDYFKWMMRTPGRVIPQTPMPRFADPRSGMTRLREILEGDSDRQFEALWHYLVDIRADREGEPVGVDRNANRPDWAAQYTKMDKGPFFSGPIEVPGYGREPKGLSIRVGDDRQATLYFDQDLLRMGLAWTGEYLQFRSGFDWGVRNSDPPVAMGDIKFTSPAVTGWTNEEEPRFIDSRDQPFGPIPEEQGRYKGLLQHGNRVVLSYDIYNTAVLESPWYLENDKAGVFVRDFQTGPHDEPLSVLLFGVDNEVEISHEGEMRIARSEQDGRVTAAAIRAGNGMELYESEGQVAIRLGPQSQSHSVRVLFWEGEAGEVNDFFELASEFPDPNRLDGFAEPGPKLWDTLNTRLEEGQPENGYAVDQLPAPLENPYDVIFHFSGIDFMDDGRAIVTTLHGDVWLIDGIDDPAGELTWHRYATGLNMPFGVRVVDGMVYVTSEDELTILHDYNGNDEADYFENFTNLIAPGAGGWRQAFGLEVDEDGYFYFARGRGHDQAGFANGLIRVSPDGKEMELIATGFRQPFGIGLSPEGRPTLSQQEGRWTPQTPVHMVDTAARKGNFYGHMPDFPEDYESEREYEPPILWIPRHVDNSAGGQVWVDSDDWGIPRGKMLHFAYGRGTLLHLMHDQVDGDRQGGVVPLVRFNQSHQRTGRYRPRDGQLYVAGFSAGGIERVRYTGEKVNIPLELYAHENGMRIRFNHPLDSLTASDEANYSVHRWNYIRSDNYGSHHYSVENPDMLGEDPVEITSVSLSSDGHEIFLNIPDMVPVDQMRITYDVKAADGAPLQEEIYNTIHALRPGFGPES